MDLCHYLLAENEAKFGKLLTSVSSLIHISIFSWVTSADISTDGMYKLARESSAELLIPVYY
jgi:hypothetical protein